MFKHILIATDGSPLSERAALRAVQLAQPFRGRNAVRSRVFERRERFCAGHGEGI